MLFTSNKHPDQWGNVLHDNDLAAAIIDRVLERGRLLLLDGPSMRTKHLGLDAPAHAAAGSPQVVRISGIHGSEFPEPTWRMAWVATVTLHDREGTALHTIRYGAMPDDGCESLLHGIAGDVNELLHKRPRLKLVLLSDGAHDLVEHLATEVAGRVKRDVRV